MMCVISFSRGSQADILINGTKATRPRAGRITARDVTFRGSPVYMGPFSNTHIVRSQKLYWPSVSLYPTIGLFKKKNTQTIFSLTVYVAVCLFQRVYVLPAAKCIQEYSVKLSLSITPIIPLTKKNQLTSQLKGPLQKLMKLCTWVEEGSSKRGR